MADINGASAGSEAEVDTRLGGNWEDLELDTSMEGALEGSKYFMFEF